jgi:hypothetical protein
MHFAAEIEARVKVVVGSIHSGMDC